MDQKIEDHLRRIRRGVGMIAGMLAFSLGSAVALGFLFAVEDDPWGMSWAALFVGLLAGVIACLAVTDSGGRPKTRE